MSAHALPPEEHAALHEEMEQARIKYERWLQIRRRRRRQYEPEDDEPLDDPMQDPCTLAKYRDDDL